MVPLDCPQQILRPYTVQHISPWDYMYPWHISSPPLPQEVSQLCTPARSQIIFNYEVKLLIQVQISLQKQLEGLHSPSPGHVYTSHDTHLQTMYRCAKHCHFISPWKPGLKDNFTFTFVQLGNLTHTRKVPSAYTLLGPHHDSSNTRKGPPVAKGDQVGLQ